MKEFLLLYCSGLVILLALWKMTELVSAALDRLRWKHPRRGKASVTIQQTKRKHGTPASQPLDELDRESELIRDPDAWKNR